MPLSRNHRTDRRRRVMLEAIAHDSELAVESAKARKRSRRTDDRDDEDISYGKTYRDPGYSQAVRKACQQRLVQLIPVKRGSVAVVLTALWILFGVMLFVHYWIHVRPPVKGSVNLAQLPISLLFHLRSPHSISHWLTGQLWLFTAVASWMIFNLRRHKLDDYRARYRIWIFIAIAALFSSFDASTSGLLLLGKSIDGWTRAEIGYAGFPLVLATFASLVGVLGIRLCGELKSVPASVVSWIVGMLAWGASALLGTDLVRTEWTQNQLGLIVGGLWLGGTLAVFQSAAMYLRSTYIQAQKRFLQRSGCELNPIQWKVPKVSFRRNRGLEEDFDSDATHADTDVPQTRERRWKMPWSQRGERLEQDVYDPSESRTKATLKQSNEDRTPNSSNKPTDQQRTSGQPRELNESDNKGRLFGVIPNRQLRNESLEFDPVREDEHVEVDVGLTKKKGWFGIGGNRDSDSARSQPKPTKQTSPQTDSEEGSEKSTKSWWPSRKSNGKLQGQSTENDSHRKSKAEPSDKEPSESRKKGWLSSLKRNPASKIKSETKADGSDRSSNADGAKRSLFGLRKPKTVISNSEVSTNATKPTAESKKDTKEKRSWFGMLDGLKLKPPTEGSTRLDNSNKSSAGPTPVKANASLPSTQDYDEEDDDNRPMSKAERKRLRRQQDDRRAA